VHLFIALFRLGLIPCDEDEFDTQPVDFRPIENLHEISIRIFENFSENEISMFVKNEIESLLQLSDEDCTNSDFLLCCPGFLESHEIQYLSVKEKSNKNSSRVTKINTSRFKTAIKAKNKKLPIFYADFYFVEVTFSVNRVLFEGDNLTMSPEYEKCPWFAFVFRKHREIPKARK